MNVKKESVVRVVDDDIGTLKAIVFLLANEGWNVKTFTSGEDFLREEASLEPGCIILDIKMMGISGLEVHQELKKRGSEVPVIFLTAHGDVPMAVFSIKEGASEFLLKPIDPEKLLDFVEKYCLFDINRRNWILPKAEAFRRVKSLSGREMQIVTLALRGITNAEIGTSLNLSKRTVECHRQAAYKKLGVNNVRDLRSIIETSEWDKNEGGFLP